MVVSREGPAGDHQSMSGAALLGLQDEIDTGWGEGGADAAGLVTDDGEDVARGNDVGSGGDDMCQQRLSTNFMKHFRKLRFQARAFAGGHDGDGYARRRRF